MGFPDCVRIMTCICIQQDRERQNRSINTLLNCAYMLSGLVLIAHTFGLVGRMYIEGRPPVTNLYSSALFISWGAVLLCFLTEKFLRLGIASYGLADWIWWFDSRPQPKHRFFLNPSGDTMEMMVQCLIQISGWLRM